MLKKTAENGITLVGRLYGDQVTAKSFGVGLEESEKTPALDYLSNLAETFTYGCHPVMVTQHSFRYWRLLQDLAEDQHVEVVPSDWFGKPNPKTGERANFSYSGMVNAGVKRALERGDALCVFVSTDISEKVEAYINLLRHIFSLDEKCIYTGIAISGIHDLDLIGKILQGRARLNASNSHLVLPNNAFGAYNVGLIRRGILTVDELLFPEWVDDGYLGKIHVGGKEVNIGGNEEVAKILMSLRKELNIYVVIELPIIREGLGTYIGNQDKMLRRAYVIDLYRKMLNVSDEEWSEYLKHHLFYLIGDFQPDSNGVPCWTRVLYPFLRTEQIEIANLGRLPSWMYKKETKILTPNDLETNSLTLLTTQT